MTDWGSYYSSGSSYRPTTTTKSYSSYIPKTTTTKPTYNVQSTQSLAPKTTTQSYSAYIPPKPAPTTTYNVQSTQSLAPKPAPYTSYIPPTNTALSDAYSADQAMMSTASRLLTETKQNITSLAPADTAMTQTASRFVQPPAPSPATPTEQAAATGRQTIAPYTEPYVEAGGGGENVMFTGEHLKYDSMSAYPDFNVGTEHATMDVALRNAGKLGLLTPEEISFLNINPLAPMDWLISDQDYNMLASMMTSQGLDSSGILGELYESTWINGHQYYVFKPGTGDVGPGAGSSYTGGGDGGGDGGGGGYGWAGPAGTTYRAPGGFRSNYTSGLVNWRIGV